MNPIKIDKDAKREAILKAAQKVFSRKGFNNARIDDVAREAGIGKGTVYEYFASKDDLFFGAFTMFFSQVAELSISDTKLKGEKASDKLTALVNTTSTMFDEMLEYFPLVMECWAASASGDHRQKFADAFKFIYDTYRGEIIKFINEGKKKGEFRSKLDTYAVASGLIGALDGFFLQKWFDPDFDLEKNSKVFATIVVKGLSK